MLTPIDNLILVQTSYSQRAKKSYATVDPKYIVGILYRRDWFARDSRRQIALHRWEALDSSKTSCHESIHPFRSPLSNTDPESPDPAIQRSTPDLPYIRPGHFSMLPSPCPHTITRYVRKIYKECNTNPPDPRAPVTSTHAG